MSGVCPQCGGYESDYGGCRSCAASSAADFAHDQALRDAASASRASISLRSVSGDPTCIECDGKGSAYGQACSCVSARLCAALELPLLFHGAGPWDEAKRARWKAITGSDEATNKVMCDHIRKALEYAR